MDTIFYILFIVLLVVFLGIELISKVPSTLHTPLMSGSNAISGITIIAAISLTGKASTNVTLFLGVIALVFATINVVGGYFVTDRMLDMFSSKDDSNDK